MGLGSFQARCFSFSGGAALRLSFGASLGGFSLGGAPRSFGSGSGGGDALRLGLGSGFLGGFEADGFFLGNDLRRGLTGIRSSGRRCWFGQRWSGYDHRGCCNRWRGDGRRWGLDRRRGLGREGQSRGFRRPIRLSRRRRSPFQHFRHKDDSQRRDHGGADQALGQAVVQIRSPVITARGNEFATAGRSAPARQHETIPK